jgi:alpha-N-arabinofuranosidase
VGSGTPQELSDWIKYTTHPNGSSPMPELRAKNGRPNPWNVRIWGLGNEAWGCGGNMTVEHYADVYRQYATFMTEGSNSYKLYKVASGASDDDYKWTEVLMQKLPKNMFDALGLHHYSVINWNKKSSSTDYSESEYFSSMTQALFMEELVTKHSAIMDKYDPNKTKALAVDEWGGWYDVVQGTNGAFLFQQNTMRDAMIAGTTLNTFNNHCDRVKMANLAQIINVLQAVILTNDEKLVLTPTYHVMEMYNVHQNAVMIPISLNTTNYELDGKRLKAVSASASKDKNGLVHISLVNIDASKEQKISIEMGDNSYTTLSGRILKSSRLQNYNSFEKPNTIVPVPFTDAKIKGTTIEVTLPAFSVAVLELKK